MTDQQLYTLWIQGGSAFQIAVPANPAVDHDGGTTVSHLVLSTQEAANLKSLLEKGGCTVSLTLMEGQTSGQEVERLSLLGVGKENVVWPSQYCPTCSWFDPVQDNPCGKVSWDFSVAETLMQNKKAQADWERCDAKG